MDPTHQVDPATQLALDRRTTLLGAAALLATALGSTRPARAQEATPGATPTTEGLPPGVALLELPQITPF